MMKFENNLDGQVYAIKRIQLNPKNSQVSPNECTHDVSVDTLPIGYSDWPPSRGLKSIEVAIDSAVDISRVFSYEMAHISN